MRTDWFLLNKSSASSFIVNITLSKDGYYICNGYSVSSGATALPTLKHSGDVVSWSQLYGMQTIQYFGDTDPFE